MPEIIVYAAEGRSVEQKRGLCRDITDAMVKHFGAAPEAVVISIMETPRCNKSKGGILFSDR